MNRKAFHVFLLGLIALGTTSANAEGVKEWVQENGKTAAVGVVAGGLTAASSLQVGAQYANAQLGVSNALIRHADEKENSTFLKAAQPFIQERDKITQIMDPFVKAQNEDKLRLEAVCKNQGCNSGVALGLQRGLQNRQSVIDKFKLRQSEFQDKIDDVRKYLASGGTAKTNLSSVESYKLNSFIKEYQKDIKAGALYRAEAKNYEKRAEKSIIGGIAGALAGVPIAIGTTVLAEKLSQRTIARKKKKLEADPHAEFSQVPVFSAPANAEAK